jgi:hypothetical protein
MVRDHDRGVVPAIVNLHGGDQVARRAHSGRLLYLGEGDVSMQKGWDSSEGGKISTCTLYAALHLTEVIYKLLFISKKQAGGYMKLEYRDLRLKQLAATLETFKDAKQTARPL